MSQMSYEYSFSIKGEAKTYYGALHAVSADNLASLALGGFNKSCSAFRMCRQCMATQDSAKSMVCSIVYTQVCDKSDPHI